MINPKMKRRRVPMNEKMVMAFDICRFNG